MAIRQLRNKVGISQRQLSELTGIPVGTIRSWEQGNRKPPSYLISLIEYKILHVFEDKENEMQKEKN